MKPSLWSIATLVVLGLSSPARAAYSDPPVPLVERGAYLGVGAGSVTILNAPGAAGRAVWGYGLTVEARWAPIERLAISLGVTGHAFRPGSGNGVLSNNATGDMVGLTPIAAVRFNAIRVSDHWDIRRLWVFIKAGAGYTFLWPRALEPNGALLLFGTLGIEYRTHLRHFSIGLEVTPSYYISPAAFSLAVTPNVQFAF